MLSAGLLTRKSMQTTRNYFFDILRILAVLLVVTSHYSYMFDTSTVLTFPREYLTGGLGRLGVSFFFMISGALAYLSLRKYSVQEYYLKRVYSILLPYNIAYFSMAILFLILSVFFLYPGNPLADVLAGKRAFHSLLPSVLGFDHYLHGVYDINTAYFTGEWFIGCIILLYAVSPVIYWAIVRFPVCTMLAAVVVTLLAYDKSIVNPYWSAQVRVSDFTFGMLFIHFQPWFTRYRLQAASVSLLLVVTGVIVAHIDQLPVREVLFPLKPSSLLFAAAFLFILLAGYPLIHPLFNLDRFRQGLSSLASRAYIIMLLQHVVVIFVSANIDMSVLNATQAVMLYFGILICIERLSSFMKPLSVKCEQVLIARTPWLREKQKGN